MRPSPRTCRAFEHICHGPDHPYSENFWKPGHHGYEHTFIATLGTFSGLLTGISHRTRILMTRSKSKECWTRSERSAGSRAWVKLIKLRVWNLSNVTLAVKSHLSR